MCTLRRTLSVCVHILLREPNVLSAIQLFVYIRLPPCCVNSMFRGETLKHLHQPVWMARPAESISNELTGVRHSLLWLLHLQNLNCSCFFFHKAPRAGVPKLGANYWGSWAIQQVHLDPSLFCVPAFYWLTVYSAAVCRFGFFPSCLR